MLQKNFQLLPIIFLVFPHRSGLHLAWMISYIFVMMPTSAPSSSPWRSASCRRWTLTSIFRFHTASSVVMPRLETKTHIPSLKREVELLWSHLTHTRINIVCVCVCVCLFVKVREKEVCVGCLCVCQVWPVLFPLCIPWGICPCVCVCVCMTGCYWLLLLVAVRTIPIFNSWINWALVKAPWFNNVFFFVFICQRNGWFY